MAFTDRVKAARLERGLTQEQLARQIGVAKSTYTGYERGNSEPNMQILSQIMEVLRVDANYLYQDQAATVRAALTTPEENQLLQKYRALDRYGKKAVDRFLETEYWRHLEIEVLLETQKEGTLSLPTGPAAGTPSVAVADNALTRKADYLLTLSEDSMEPIFSQGDRVLVQSQSAVELGELGVYAVNSVLCVREYRGKLLHSPNPVYPDLPCTENTCCYGKVIGLLPEDWLQ